MITDDFDIDDRMEYLIARLNINSIGFETFVTFYRAYFDPEYLIPNPNEKEENCTI
jgi:hypothetical protein